MRRGVPQEELPLSTRVHELAKELGLKSQELIDRIQKWGLDVKTSALAVIDPPTVDRIKQLIKGPVSPPPVPGKPAPAAPSPRTPPATRPAHLSTPSETPAISPSATAEPRLSPGAPTTTAQAPAPPPMPPQAAVPPSATSPAPAAPLMNARLLKPEAGFLSLTSVMTASAVLPAEARLRRPVAIKKARSLRTERGQV